MPRNKRKNQARAIAHQAKLRDETRQKRVDAARQTGASERVNKALTLIEGRASPRGQMRSFLICDDGGYLTTEGD